MATTTTGRRDSTGRTPISTFRLAEDTLAEMRYLRERLGLRTMTDIVRTLVRAAARKEGYSPPAGGPRKISK